MTALIKDGMGNDVFNDGLLLTADTGYPVKRI